MEKEKLGTTTVLYGETSVEFSKKAILEFNMVKQYALQNKMDSALYHKGRGDVYIELMREFKNKMDESYDNYKKIH